MRWLILQALLFIPFLCGCGAVTKPVSTAGSVTVKAVSITGNVAAQTVKTSASVTSQVVKTGSKTTLAIAKEGVKTGAEVAKHQTVFLKDVATGVIKEVPWKEGLKLYAATQGADIDMYGKAFTIFRNGGEKVIKTDWKKINKSSGNPELKPGDYVEIKPMKK
ncbi:MAG: hypothetical protein ACP5T0_10855 [Verrucomicrobiia bacterium]